MDNDLIAEVGFNEKGQLYATPLKNTFPYIYREAMEIHWEKDGHYLYAPAPPRAQLATSIWWFQQILAAAKEQGCTLGIAPQTTWRNIPQELKEEITSLFGSIPLKN